MPDQLIDYEGSLLDIDNSLTDDLDCCCDQPGDCCSEVTAIEVTISGVSGIGCTINDTFIVPISENTTAETMPYSPDGVNIFFIEPVCYGKYEVPGGYTLEVGFDDEDILHASVIGPTAASILGTYSVGPIEDCCAVDSTGITLANGSPFSCEDFLSATFRLQTICGASFTLTRKQICQDCKFFSCKGCSLYLKPCTVKRLWADQIDPPSQCPNKEKFYD